jgi:hypothetical protein
MGAAVASKLLPNDPNYRRATIYPAFPKGLPNCV